MFRALACLVLATALIPAAFAQGEPAWNRRVSDVHIVHPPGTPPGTWRAQAILEILDSPAAPVPTNLAFDLTLSINGVPFGLDSIDVNPQLFPNQCAFQCPSVVCNQLNLTSLVAGNSYIVDSYCYDPPGPQYGCNCWLVGYGWWWPMDFVLNPSDVITVDISARPGSLPEIDTSDDSFTIPVYERAPGVEYCLGDGSGTACPCSNHGAVDTGCPNSVNPSGAHLGALGNGSVASDSVVLTGSGMPNSSCLYFQGTGTVNGGAGSVFGDGLRCAGGSVIRLATKANAAGSSQYPDAGDPPVTVRGLVPAAGGTRTYQAWYRNAADFCTISTFNLTNAVSIAWQP
jgi:hypothetical protein